MAIIEIALPQLIKDPKVIEKAMQSVLPPLLVKFKDAGVISGLRGFIKSQDGQDVASSFREILLLEWPNTSSFFKFIASPGFAEFQKDLKPYATGPPELKLYETNTGMETLLQSANLEVLIIRPKDTTQPEAIASLSETVASRVKKTNGAYFIHGDSTNLEKKEIVVFGSFLDQSEFKTIEKKDFIDSMRGMSNVTQLVAEVNRIPL